MDQAKESNTHLVSKFICWVSALFRLMVTGDGVCLRTSSKWLRSLSQSLRNSVFR